MGRQVTWMGGRTRGSRGARLRLHGVDQIRLLGHSGGESEIERAGVADAATGHFGDLCIVARAERREPVAPAQRLGVVGVATLARRRDRGWRITFLGSDTPLETLTDAVTALQPEVVVLAATTPARFESGRDAVRPLARALYRRERCAWKA